MNSDEFTPSADVFIPADGAERLRECGRRTRIQSRLARGANRSSERFRGGTRNVSRVARKFRAELGSFRARRERAAETQTPGGPQG